MIDKEEEKIQASFDLVKDDMETQKTRTCNLANLLLKILPKKTLQKKVEHGVHTYTVEEFLREVIDP
jgi:hypothetical protein